LGEKNVTGIFGPNGCGKSTILHTLLCLYKPKLNSSLQDYKYSNFFISVDDNKWIGSKFSYSGSFSINGNVRNFTKTINKTKNRWLHDYGERPDRDIYFIGINTCVPEVEIDNHESIKLVDQVTAINHSEDIIKAARDIMNFNYQECDYKNTKQKKYISCKNAEISYISLSMGAGEQRLFKILEILLNATKYSLIIIDEIDLTLHSAALNKLISKIVEIADKRNLQVVFTSHRQELVKRTDINIRHIIPSTDTTDTICLEETTTECVERLTGECLKPIEIFVEDDLAKALVEEVAHELGIQSKVSIYTYGSATNAFYVVAGLHYSKRLTNNILVVTDGDVYTKPEERIDIMNKVISGNEHDKERLRQNLLKYIVQFNLPEGKSPDAYIHDELIKSTENNEIIKIANGIIGVNDNHQYTNEIIEKLGGNKDTGLYRIVCELKKLPCWNDYTLPIKGWLSSKIAELKL
jgi:AAA15 family ATPase/GTPase